MSAASSRDASKRAHDHFAKPGVEHPPRFEKGRPVVGNGADYRVVPGRQRFLVAEAVLQGDPDRPGPERGEGERGGGGRVRLYGNQHEIGSKTGQFGRDGSGGRGDGSLRGPLDPDAVPEDLGQPLSPGDHCHRVPVGKPHREDAAGRSGAKNQKTQRFVRE